MRERAQELKAEARASKDRAAGRAPCSRRSRRCRTRTALWPEARRDVVVKTTAAPELASKLYDGQPGYARKGKVVCFFRSGQMDKERYSTFGFSAEANLDDQSGLWPTSYALTELTAADEAKIGALVKKAVS